MSKKIFSVVMALLLAVSVTCYPVKTSACDVEIEMAGVYVGGIETKTGAAMGFDYTDRAIKNDSQTKVWYVECTIATGETLFATVRCKFDDRALANYDMCKVTRMPEAPSCVYAYVKNDSGKRVDTDVAAGTFASQEVEVKHTGPEVTFGCIFGRKK